jgi:HTH-type transcriptional regulator/antitoxin HigA
MAEEIRSPGKHLQEAIEAHGWTQTEFAEIVGRPGRLVSEIIAEKRGITPDTAVSFAAALNTTPEYWMSLDTAYQLSKANPAADRINRKARLHKRFPVREMLKRGWIKDAPSDDELEQAVLKFFGITSVDDPIAFDHAARRNYGTELSTIQEAWLMRVYKLASALDVPKYSESLLREAVGRLELLMTEPEEIRHVPRVLTECGVRFVIVEPIPGSRIDGVCFWLDKNRSPVIGLSFKGGDQIDRFWFNLRHEIEHVLRGDGRTGAVVDDFEDAASAESEAEQAANFAAADFCVPQKRMDDFVARHHPIYTNQALVGFSRLMKRHPGIVAGQLQKRLNRWDLFKKFQAKVRHIITQTALTDGYGRTISIEL